MGRKARAHSLSIRSSLRFRHASTKRVRVLNTGTAATRIRSVKLRAEPTLHGVRTTKRCSRGDVLRTGQSCFVAVRYRPDGRSLSTGRVLIRGRAGKAHTVRLKAR